MAILIADPPAEAPGLIERRLGLLQQRAAADTPHALRNLATAPQLELRAPHPIYAADLAAVAEGALFERAEQIGWRYLLYREDTPVAAAELDGVAGKLKFASFNHGPFVDSTAEAFPRALDNANDGRVDLELRLLRLPALHVEAIWLHPRGPGEGILMPLPPVFYGLEPFASYKQTHFVAALAPHAKRLLEIGGEGEEMGS